MADPPSLLGDQGSNSGGFLQGLLSLFRPTDYSAEYTGSLAKDPATGQMDPAVQRAFAMRALAGASQAFAEGGMPVPYKGGIPLLSTIGKAGAAATLGPDSLMAARLQAAQQQQAMATAAFAQNRAGLVQSIPGLLKDYYGSDGSTGTGTGTDGKPKTGPAKVLAEQGGGGGGISPTDHYTFLLNNGASKNEATMLTSAANSESSFRPDLPHDGGIGYGLYGHNAERLAAMRTYAGVGPNDPVPWQQQALYALAELRGQVPGLPGGGEPKAGAMVNAATNPEQLTAAQLAFERPNLNIAGGNRAQRLASTTEYWNKPPYQEQPTQVASAAGAQPGGYGPGAGGVYVPPGGTQPLDIRTGQPVNPATGQPAGPAPAPAGPPMAPPQPKPPNLLTPQGAAAFGASAVPPQLAPTPGGAPSSTPGPQSLLAQPPSDAPAPSPDVQAMLTGMANAQRPGQPPGAQFAGSGAAEPPSAAPPPSALPPALAAQTGAAGAAQLQGLLNQPPVPPAAAPAPGAPQAAPAPPGPPSMPPPPPSMPMPSAAVPPPQGAIPGAPSPERIAKARQIAAAFDAAGLTVPADIAETAKFNLVGPTAQATAAGTAAGQLPYQQALEQQKAQWQVWVEQQKPQVYRPGSYVKNPYTGQTEYNPEIVKTTDPKTGQQWQWYSYPPSTPDGVPRYVSIGPGEAPPRTKTREETGGRIEGETAPIPAPQQPAPPPGSPQRPVYPGTPLAPGMTSKEPDYQEPQFNEQQLKAGYAAENWPKTTRELTASLGPAQQAEQRLTNIASAFQLVGTRAFTSDKANWNNALDGIFGPNGGPSWLRTSTDPGAVMTALHETQRATLSNLKATNPRFANAEFQSLSKMSENPDLPASANVNMLSEDIAQLRQQQGLAQGWIAARAAGKQDPDLFQAQWLKQNPLAPITEAVKKEISVGQLAPPTGQGAASPAQPQRAQEGQTVQGPDGQLYVIHNGVPVHKQTLQPYQPPGGR